MITRMNIWLLLFILFHFSGVIAITPTELQSDLNSAISNQQIDSYRIPNGNYHFINTDFVIKNAINFTVYSSSSTIIYLNCSYQVLALNNSNVTINNISIDYDPPCFSQGIIENINFTESSLTVLIDDGFPLPDNKINDIFNAKIIKVIYWNSTTKQIIGTTNIKSNEIFIIIK